MAGLLGFKACYLGLVAGAVMLWGEMHYQWYELAADRWPEGPSIGAHFATGGAVSYLRISEEGYSRGDPNCAFYPLWPTLIRWAAPLTGGDRVAAGLVLSNLCSLVAWVLCFERVRRRWGTAAAHWALLALIVFPGSLFYQFLYTESLFLLLVVLLWWGLEEKRWVLAWGAAFLLPLTRAIGVFAILPIAWAALTTLPPQRWWSYSRFPRLRGSSPPSVRVWSPWALLTAPLLGWAAYLFLMQLWTGNRWEGFEAQQYWGAHSVWNLVNIPKFVVGFFTPTRWHGFGGSVLDRGAFLLLLYTLPLIWRLDKGLLVWTYWLGILPAMSGTFTSYTRFASCAFPIFLAIGVFLGGGGGGVRDEKSSWDSQLSAGSVWRLPKWIWWCRWGLLAVFAVGHTVLVWRFVNFRWAG